MGGYEFLHFPAESVQVAPERLGRLPPSARRVFASVCRHGPVTHPQLRVQTGMPARTIRFAIRRLRDEGLVDVRSSLRDSRTACFFVNPSCVGDEALRQARERAHAAARHGSVVEAVQVPAVPSAGFSRGALQANPRQRPTLTGSCPDANGNLG